MTRSSAFATASHDGIRAAIEAAHRKQLDWADQADRSGRYPSHIISAVHAAAGAARSTLLGVLDEHEGAGLFDAMQAALDDGKRRFHELYADEDGYGSATFGEMGQALYELAKD